MTTQQTIKFSSFNSKEHYFAFRKAWAVAVNDPRAKPHLEPCNEFVYRTNTFGQKIHYKPIISEGTGKKRIPGWLTRSHHVLYNLLLNRPVETGFTPITNKTKLKNGTYFNFGLYFAVRELKWFIDFEIKRSQREVEGWFKQENKDWATEKVEKFLAPFDGTVTIDMILALEIPKIEPMYSTYNKKGAEIIEKLDEIKPITYNQLQALYSNEGSIS